MRQMLAKTNSGLAASERPSVYALMSDNVLERAVANLERIVSQFPYSSGPIADAVRAGYEAALDQARAEIERRRT